jgi:Uma2 family endonuclease
MNVLLKPRLTVPEYLTWAAAQPRGRFELVNGQPVAMSPERLRHVVVKSHAWAALRDGIAKAKLPCTAFADGATVVIDKTTAREPDAAVQCGTTFDLDSMVLDAPIIIVEVVLPSSEQDDTTAKFVEYFSLASVRHYLIIHPLKRVVIHHARDAGGGITSRIVNDGAIHLDPPGFAVDAADMLGPTT